MWCVCVVSPGLADLLLAVRPWLSSSSSSLRSAPFWLLLGLLLRPEPGERLPASALHSAGYNIHSWERSKNHAHTAHVLKANTLHILYVNVFKCSWWGTAKSWGDTHRREEPDWRSSCRLYIEVQYTVWQLQTEIKTNSKDSQSVLF